MAMVDSLDYLESSSIEGMYTLLANFKYGVNVDVAYQDALAAMARVARQLPKDIDPPLIFKADPSQLPVVQLTISSDVWDLTKLRTWTENWLQYQLQAVPGVAGTDIVGGLKREIRVHLDPNAVEKYGLTLPAVTKRLQEENLEQFGGRVTVGRREFIARTMGEYRTLDDIRNVVLANGAAGKIYLKDVARVEDAHEEVRVITRLGGKPSVKLSVLKQADANTVEVARAVNQRIEQLTPVITGRRPNGDGGKPGGLRHRRLERGAQRRHRSLDPGPPHHLSFSGKLAPCPGDAVGPPHHLDYQLRPDAAHGLLPQYLFSGRHGGGHRRGAWTTPSWCWKISPACARCIRKRTGSPWRSGAPARCGCPSWPPPSPPWPCFSPFCWCRASPASSSGSSSWSSPGYFW